MTEPCHTAAMNNMTWQEFAANRENSILTICTGSVEQHGPHLPLCVDHLIPYHLALGLAREKPVILAPPLYYGYRSQPATGGGQSFPGTTSLSGQTYTLLIRDILLDFVRQGCRRFLIMNGHFENTAYAAEAAYQVASVHGEVKIVLINWWELLDEDTLNLLFPQGFPGWEVEHASLVETSLVMHFRPELVRPERIPKQEGVKFKARPLVFPEPRGMVPESGILFSAGGAGAEIGATIAGILSKELKDIVTKEFFPNLSA